MTTEKRDEKYINGPTFQSDLEQFRQWMAVWGFTGRCVELYSTYVRRCERVVGGIDPRFATSDTDRELETAYSDRSPNYRRTVLRVWRDFVTVTRSVDDHGGFPYMMSAEFRDDLDRFASWLAETGAGRVAIGQAVHAVRQCFWVMVEEFGDLRPEDVDDDVIVRIRDLLSARICRNTYLRYLRQMGVFVNFLTGRNPFRDLTLPNRHHDFMSYVYRVPAGQRFEQEMIAYAAALEHRGYRPVTISTKLHSVIYAFRHLEDLGWSGEIRDITPEVIEFTRGHTATVAQDTVRSRLTELGAFVEFVTDFNPFKEARLLWNQSEQLVKRKFIVPEQWTDLKECADPDQFVILALGAGLGMRRAEIAGLLLEDIGERTITIRGKGSGPNGKVVTKELIPAVKDAIEAYMPMRQRTIDLYGDRSEGHLLVKHRIQPGEYMTPDNVSSSMLRLKARSGIDFSPHSLRRLYATTLYDAGTDLDTLRRMMRHESIDTTMRCYLDADPRKMSKANDRLSETLFG